MPLISMTGFGEARGTHGDLRWRWETRSVNGRGLDVRFRAPTGFEGLEVGARALVAERLKRSSVQIVLTAVSDETVRGFRIDPVALADAVKIAKRIAEETGLPPARIDGLLALKGVVVQEEQSVISDDVRLARDAALLEGLVSALDMMANARKAEGKKLETVLVTEIAEIETLSAQIRALASAQPAVLRERMMTQLSDILGENSNLPEDRIAQEVALLAMRADLREEIDRLLAHCQEARVLFAAKEPAGRKLDFLSQEFNREANTLCAKSSDIALTRLGLALKAVIDQFREQVQNVE